MQSDALFLINLASQELMNETITEETFLEVCKGLAHEVTEQLSAQQAS